METCIGVDLGGTGLKLGECGRDGRLLRRREVPSGRLSQSEAMEKIEAELADFLADPAGDPAAVGIGMIGRVDPTRGVWLEIDPAHSEPIPAAARIEARFGLPCRIDNDVRTAARAEARFGAGRGCAHWIYINVGTGLAAATISGGRVIVGGHCNAGEVGHTASGIAFRAPCGCGRPDCAEPVASGMGLDLSARLLAAQYPATRLVIPENGRVRAETIFALAEDDALCRTLTDNAAAALANLIMNLTRFSDPERIVLGGGLLTDDFLLDRIRARLHAHTMRYVTGGVVRTALDPRAAGILGACVHAAEGR